ncbi:Maebl [Ahniella affigens]|uniref:Maebl n=1 Tax=Ahniella affigens TaxID=2021234 RepID=A0A2P1PRH7_9GAMM|nr:NYN domain-containing protein [Ahniella affigens]AVP97449.1 Maebl [Ahniella affigens]
MAQIDGMLLAVLIDADNAQAAIIGELLNEVAAFGIATVKRAYGDWTTPSLAGWKKTLHDHAIQPIQQFQYTTGKNATDSALIIDAMDLLHGGRLGGFCLVSSDSDFTRLATRIRESGLVVYGFGEKKTPKPFVAACNRFIYTEVLRKGDVAPTLEAESPQALIKSLREAIAACAEDDGWAFLGSVGQWLVKNDPAFDPRNFGYKKLGELVRAQKVLEVDVRRTSENPNSSILYVRAKPSKKPA